MESVSSAGTVSIYIHTHHHSQPPDRADKHITPEKRHMYYLVSVFLFSENLQNVKAQQSTYASQRHEVARLGELEFSEH
jgi:hypothetical protein